MLMAAGLAVVQVPWAKTIKHTQSMAPLQQRLRYVPPHQLHADTLVAACRPSDLYQAAQAHACLLMLQTQNALLLTQGTDAWS